MLAAVDSATPPLRLLLGADAIGLWDGKQSRIASELSEWRATRLATAFDAAPVVAIGG